MTCILSLVFGVGFGYPKRMHSLNMGMFLRFISAGQELMYPIMENHNTLPRKLKKIHLVFRFLH